MLKFKATKNDAGRILFKFVIKSCNNVPVSKIEKVFRKKDVRVNGIKTNDKQYKIQENDEICVYGIENAKKDTENWSKTNVTFKKIYEDNNILIVDKKPNVPMVGTEDCLNNQVLTYLKFKQTDSFIPDSIGRLDKVTSGLVIYAKNYQTLVEFKQKHNDFIKTYEFISDFEGKDTVTVRLVKDIEKQKMRVDSTQKQGIRATTHFYTDNAKKFAVIQTGKKHQIRATLQYLGFPILGDTKYGGKKSYRVFLHSYSVKLQNLGSQWDYLNDQEFICYPKW